MKHPLRDTPLALVFTAILLLGGANAANAEDPKANETPPATASQPAAEPAHVEAPPTAVAAVDSFYQDYLNFHPAGDDEESLPPEIGLSESFKTDIKKSDEVCQNFDDGPCGWGADGDQYLDSQDPDPDLDYKNSGIAITEPEPGNVQVKLNVNPSLPEGNFRTITYKMVQEDGKWVADDILYHDEDAVTSTRQMLAEERADIEKAQKEAQKP
ncbi:hypothetical protein VSS37_11595 [Candidatus Thiothrix sp. Deng01]|uniref:DUF3828 domain-containing protein n=1 Tax=Candidatus Thiothrix phosphatis TaxID=3112415 RepID=A0ABU6CXR8_9GAMM|nr:hypothetical protein [Candidatus Thiothrix sp. Deng01]MEB4591625.1 hypothetical protein [Candidatus Thiothrix sp. Deng01]